MLGLLWRDQWSWSGYGLGDPGTALAGWLAQALARRVLECIMTELSGGTTGAR